MKIKTLSIFKNPQHSFWGKLTYQTNLFARQLTGISDLTVYVSPESHPDYYNKEQYFAPAWWRRDTRELSFDGFFAFENSPMVDSNPSFFNPEWLDAHPVFVGIVAHELGHSFHSLNKQPYSKAMNPNVQNLVRMLEEGRQEHHFAKKNPDLGKFLKFSTVKVVTPGILKSPAHYKETWKNPILKKTFIEQYVRFSLLTTNALVAARIAGGTLDIDDLPMEVKDIIFNSNHNGDPMQPVFTKQQYDGFMKCYADMFKLEDTDYRGMSMIAQRLMEIAEVPLDHAIDPASGLKGIRINPCAGTSGDSGDGEIEPSDDDLEGSLCKAHNPDSNAPSIPINPDDIPEGMECTCDHDDDDSKDDSSDGDSNDDSKDGDTSDGASSDGESSGEDSDGSEESGEGEESGEIGEDSESEGSSGQESNGSNAGEMHQKPTGEEKSSAGDGKDSGEAGDVDGAGKESETGEIQSNASDGSEVKDSQKTSKRRPVKDDAQKRAAEFTVKMIQNHQDSVKIVNPYHEEYKKKKAAQKFNAGSKDIAKTIKDTGKKIMKNPYYGYKLRESIDMKSRKPFPEEDRFMKELSLSLGKAQFREFGSQEVKLDRPPGRFSVREAMRMQMQKEKHLEKTAKPWSYDRYQEVEEPPLTVGISIDVSPSMDEYMHSVAGYSWILSEAIRQNKGTIASTFWDTHVFGGLMPGVFQKDVIYPSKCDNGSSGLAASIMSLNGMLDYQNVEGLKVLIILTDSDLPADDDINGALRMMESFGVKIIWISTEKSTDEVRAKYLDEMGTTVYLHDPNDFGKIVTPSLIEELTKTVIEW